MSQVVLKSFSNLIKLQRSQVLLNPAYNGKYLSKSNHTDAAQRNTRAQPLTNLSANHYKLDDATQRELQHLGSFANDWWNMNGPVKPLHSLNALRVPFIRDGLVARGNIPSELLNTSQILKDQLILEVGCGGGILTEELARLNARVTGIDLSEDLIRIARVHILQQADPKLCGLIQYKTEPVEVHAKEKVNYYDAVILSEVLEHVDDKITLLNASVQCLKPGGSLFITTQSKTIPMWINFVLLGEYFFRVIPFGTHHYNKMISPLDVQRILDTMGCHTVVVNGSIYDFWNDTWRWINSNKFCYALQAIKSNI